MAVRSRTWSLTEGGGPIWHLPLFLPLGMFMCWTILLGMNHLHNNAGTIGIAAILLGPPLAIYGVIVARQTWAAEWALVTQLKWWDYLWLLIFIGGLTFRNRTPTSSYNEPVDSAAAYRLVMVSFAAFWLLGALFLRSVHWVQSMFRGLVGCLTIFALYATLTTVWSVFPSWTFYKGCEYSVDCAALGAILYTVRSIDGFKSLFDWTWTLEGLALLSAYVGILIDPKAALERGFSFGSLGVRLKGIYPIQGANRIGDLGAILAVVALARWIPMEGRCRKNCFFIFLGLFGGLSLILSQTRTAMLGCAVGAFVVLWVSRRIDLRKLLTVGVASAVLLTFIMAATPIGDVVFKFLKRGQSDAEFDTLSGRLVWWEAAWTLYAATPLGIGMGAFAAEKIPSLNAMGMSGSTLHSDYMETILGTGFLGLMPLLAALGGTWWYLLKSVHDPVRSPMERQLSLEALGVLGVLTVRTVFMDIMILHPAQHYLVIVGLAEFFRRQNLARSSWR